MFLSGLIPCESCCLLGPLAVLQDVWQALLPAGCREPSPRAAVPIKGVNAALVGQGVLSKFTALSLIHK